MRERERGGDEEQVVSLSSLEDLAAVAGFRSLSPFNTIRQVLLRIPGVPSPFQQATERRLNQWLAVCGCKAGALFFLGALLWQFLGSSTTYSSALEAVLFASVMVVGTGIVGKLVSIGLARAAFKADVAVFVWRIKSDLRKGKTIL